MEHFIIRGNEEDVISELSKYMDTSGARTIVRNLSFFNDLIDDDEILEINGKVHGQGDRMEFMVPKTNYYINLKMTTIAFMGLLLDIGFTEGITSFVLNIFGVAADAIRKLSDTEKCVLLLIKRGFILIDESKYVLDDPTPCINYARYCDCRQYDKCNLPKDILYDTVQKLLGKNIIRHIGDSLVYRF